MPHHDFVIIIIIIHFYKDLLQNTPYIKKMYKEIKLKKKEKWQDVKSVKNRCQNLSMSITNRLWSTIFVNKKLTACNKLVVVMGGVFRGGGRQ